MPKHTIENILKIECPSDSCKKEVRNFFYTGEVGVPWNKRLLYMCSTCAYPLLVKLKKEART